MTPRLFPPPPLVFGLVVSISSKPSAKFGSFYLLGGLSHC